MTATSPPAGSSRLLPLLLTVAVAALLVAAFAVVGWVRSARAPVSLDELPATDRQRLVAEVERVLPGVHRAAWFQPEIGYTLHPDSEIEAWEDAFRSNEIGYRSGAVDKRPGVFRVLFVGDSWTYGMGVREQESYPKVLERLANEHAGLDRPVEAWTLALPGYNTLNQIAAFDLWFGRLRPNAVVLAPSSNDHHSAPQVLPSGELFHGIASGRDEFGSPHPHVYRMPLPIESFVHQQRWRIAWERLRGTEEKLDHFRIPSFLFFVALWDPAIAHRTVHDAGFTSPYAVVPAVLTLEREWVNPGVTGHGNPEANRRYAELLYRLMASTLGWRPLPEEVRLPEVAGVPVFAEPPPESEWRETSDALLRFAERRFVPAAYRAGDAADSQWVGPGDVDSGIVGRAVTVLVRPPAGTSALRVTVARLAGLRAFYPVRFEVAVPGPDGGSRRAGVLAGDGPVEATVEVEVPETLRDGRVLDVVVEASAVALLADGVAASLRVVSVEAGGAGQPEP